MSFREQMRLGPVPCLLLGKGHPYRGTVLVYHGLGANKQTNEKELHSLAERGFLAVGVDAVGHGDRAEERWTRALDSDFHQAFVEIVLQTSGEVPTLIRQLRERSDGLGNVGMVGISMGACIVFHAASNQSCLGAAAALIGSPDFSLGGRRPVSSEHWRESPHLTPEWFNPLPLLVQNAGRDQHVNPQPARDFVAEASLYYRDEPERLQYYEYPNSDHFMEPTDWELMWSRTLGWFERFL